MQHIQDGPVESVTQESILAVHAPQQMSRVHSQKARGLCCAVLTEDATATKVRVELTTCHIQRFPKGHSRKDCSLGIARRPLTSAAKNMSESPERRTLLVKAIQTKRASSFKTMISFC